MYKKKMTVLALASLITLSVPLMAEEGSGDEAASADAAEAPAEDTASSGYAAPSDDPRAAAMQQRWREREARYEDLKQRAKEVGVMLPEDPPWKSSSMGAMPEDMAERMQRHQAMMSMTPEERMAAREEYYKEMQARAKERGMDLPDTPPWKARQSAMDEAWEKHRAVIDGMTDEERAACHAMHQRHMGMMRDFPERPMMRNPGMVGPGTMRPGTMGPGTMGPGTMGPGTMGPGMMGPGMMGPGMMGPGYGYGPNPYGSQNFWDPNQ
ncbi:MAG: hypothetical protein P8103_19975 [Candidatus Thiodiazotropha sp.]